jgi:hypothetical protein
VDLFSPVVKVPEVLMYICAEQATSIYVCIYQCAYKGRHVEYPEAINKKIPGKTKSVQFDRKREKYFETEFFFKAACLGGGRLGRRRPELNKGLAPKKGRFWGAE